VTFERRISELLAAVPSLQSKVGVFVSRQGNQVTVNVGETTVTLPFTGITLPPPGHPVRIESRSGTLVVTGAARPLPGQGIITAAGSPTATVTAWDVAYQLPFRAGYTPAVNDQVDISWSADGGIIQGSLSTTPVSPTVAPEKKPAAGPKTYHPAPFTATWSGTWNGSRWWLNDVWAGDNSFGAWGYGGKIADSIPDSAEIVSAAIYLPGFYLFGAMPNLGWHTSGDQPAGNVALNAAAALPDRNGWVTIPTSIIDALKTSAGGVGFNHGGFNKYRGTQADGLSGALDITWIA
jgi:hypothetical protein